MKKNATICLILSLLFIGANNVNGQGYIDPDLSYDLRINSSAIGLKGKVNSVKGSINDFIPPHKSLISMFSYMSLFGRFTEEANWYYRNEFSPLGQGGFKECDFNEYGNVTHCEWFVSGYDKPLNFNCDYSYDSNQRVDHINFSCAVKSLHQWTISFSYDEQGLLVKKEKKNITPAASDFRLTNYPFKTTYTYDENRRVKEVLTQWFDSNGKLLEKETCDIIYTYKDLPPSDVSSIFEDLAKSGDIIEGKKGDSFSATLELLKNKCSTITREEHGYNGARRETITFHNGDRKPLGLYAAIYGKNNKLKEGPALCPYVYDKEGRLYKDPSTTYYYNEQGILKRFINRSGGASNEYIYDEHGNWITASSIGSGVGQIERTITYYE